MEYDPKTNKINYSVKDILIMGILGISIGISWGMFFGYSRRREVERNYLIQSIQQPQPTHNQPFIQSELSDKLNKETPRLK